MGAWQEAVLVSPSQYFLYAIIVCLYWQIFYAYTIVCLSYFILVCLPQN